MKLINSLFKSIFQSKLLLAFSAIVLFVFIINSCQENIVMTTESESITFSPNIPVDVDPALQAKLKSENDYYALNQAFNEYSWKAFVAIQWPMDEDGIHKPNFTDEGSPTWLSWKEAFQVYRDDGKKPAKWGSKRTDTGLGLPLFAINNPEARVFLKTSTPTHPDNFNTANEVDQAFAGKLFDQNGNTVVYEVLMNESEFNYIVANDLYNINGQLEFTKDGAIANFPIGNYDTDSLGAVEIKFAWKILEETDYKERYFTNKGYILNEAKDSLELRNLGMIGMHISQKTPTGKQWVWSTFEHIDNLDENVVEVNGEVKTIHPTLRDPKCEICPANIDVTNGTTFKHNTGQHGDYWTISGSNAEYFANSEVMKTQSKRMVDIPIRVKNINDKMQAYFKKQNSVWQYYQLIDTQFPLDQNARPGPNKEDDYIIPNSVINKPGGNPNLALLTNITMETFFQLGNQSAANLMEGNPKSPIQIFGTESCMGCHSSAGIAVSYDPSTNQVNQGGQLSGDFSWLLGSANWDGPAPTLLNK